VTIKACIAKGDRAIEQAEDYYKAAGIHLLEARARLKESREMRWSAFLFSHARISDDTARRYMALADGSKTLEEIRETAREGMRASRARKTKVAAEAIASPDSANVSGEPLAPPTPAEVTPLTSSSELAALQKEITDLKATLAERDAEIERLKAFAMADMTGDTYDALRVMYYSVVASLLPELREGDVCYEGKQAAIEEFQSIPVTDRDIVEMASCCAYGHLGQLFWGTRQSLHR
jgi:hypothetical protein